MTYLGFRQIPMNRLQILMGLCGLIIGLSVYIISRPPESAYLLSVGGFRIDLYSQMPDLFGWLGGILPAFAHPFSFSLLTAGFLCCRKRGILLICVMWFVIDVAFELGQKFSTFILEVIPDSLEGVPVLENAKYFFINGTFDPLDIASIGFGSLSAFFVLLFTLNHGEERERGS